MALEAAADLVFSYGPVSTSSGVFGVVAQEDKSYLFGFSEGSDTFPFPNVGHWYRSTDNGATWSAVDGTRGTIGMQQQFPTNIHSNIICAATSNASALTKHIERSTDHGANWTDVFSCASAASPNGRTVNINGVQSFNQTYAVAWGELDGSGLNPAHLIALSDDAGATWTPQVTWDSGDKFDTCNALGVAEDGYMFAQYTKRGGVNRTSHFARSINGGLTWSVLSSPPGGSGTPTNRGEAICCLDKNNIVLVGQLGAVPASSAPGVWWSDDAGTTLNLVTASNIASFPTGSFNTVTREAKRLTRDSCIIAFDQQNGTPGSPWRISLDKGQTFPIIVTQNTPGAAVYQVPFGKIVVTRNGKLLLPMWSSPDYGAAYMQLWRATVTC